jgi:hypothetical protein
MSSSLSLLSWLLAIAWSRAVLVSVYVSPSGNDSLAGDSPTTAVYSATRLRSVISSATAGVPSGLVLSVFFASGVYRSECAWNISAPTQQHRRSQSSTRCETE